MAPTDLRECFKVFDLSTDATISDLDEQYSYMSCEVHKKKAKDPDVANKQQRELDNNYYVLLQEFIRRDCREQAYDSATNLNIANVTCRRDDPGVTRKISGRRDALEMRYRSTEELMRLARDDAANGDDSDESEGHLYHSTSGSKIFKISEWEGDIFEAPDNAVIVHAVNCQGVWGSGFAAALRGRFPAAYAEYAHWCRTTKPRSLLAGNCLLIPPQPADYASEGKPKPRRWIACLFTSEGFGRANSYTSNPGKDDEDIILMHTDSSLVDLRTDLAKVGSLNRGRKPTDLYSPRINAGSFGIPWKCTKEIIAMCFAGYSATWHVVSLPKNEEWPSRQGNEG